MFFCSVCVPSRSATSWAAQGLEAVRWPCTWSRFGATGQPCPRVDNAPSLFVFLLSLPGKAGIKREGSYFSGRLQAPSFPSPSTLRAKSWQFKVVVALSWCAEEAGRFWPQVGSFCSPLAAFTGEGWSIGCSIKAPLDIRERKCRLQSPLLAFSLWKCTAESAFLRILNIPLGVPSCPPTSYPFPVVRSLGVWVWGPQGTPTLVLPPKLSDFEASTSKEYVLLYVSIQASCRALDVPHSSAAPLPCLFQLCTDYGVCMWEWGRGEQRSLGRGWELLEKGQELGVGWGRKTGIRQKGFTLGTAGPLWTNVLRDSFQISWATLHI